MRIYLTFMLFLIMNVGFTQDFLWKVQANYGVTFFRSTTFGYDISITPGGGVYASYKLTNKVRISSGLAYQRVSSTSWVTLRDNNNYIVGEDQIQLSTSYLNIPIDLELYIGKNNRSNFKIGVFTGILLAHGNSHPDQIQNISSYQLDGTVLRLEDSYKPFNFGLGCGYSINFYRNDKLFIDIGIVDFQYGLMNIKASEDNAKTTVLGQNISFYF